MAYPTDLDTFPTVTPTTLLNDSLAAHASLHTKLQNSIIAIETELGFLPKGSDTTVADRLNNLKLGNARVFSGLSAPSGTTSAGDLWVKA